MKVNGWTLYQYPLFEATLVKLKNDVAELANTQPGTYKDHPKTKLLATIWRRITEIIPADPNAAEFRQGNTLGEDNRHWFRAKFHERFRLFFRFSSKQKIIVYVWVNDKTTLRKRGAPTDAYSIFTAMLHGGEPPQSLEDLLKKAHELQGQATVKETSTKPKPKKRH